MKKIKTICICMTLALSLCLMVLYFAPSMRTLRRMPQSIGSNTIYNESMKTVGFSSDERLADKLALEHLSLNNNQYEFKLFGLIPLKTARVASSNVSVIPGGDAIGVMMYTKGVQVVGTGSVLTEHGRVSPASQAGIIEGDSIIAVNDVEVSGTEHFVSLCSGGADSYEFRCERAGNEYFTYVTPVFDISSGAMRIGAWVRDSTSGLGTLSFYDSNSSKYTALGHAVTDIDTGAVLLMREGRITRAELSGIEKGISGKPGELLGSFSKRQSDMLGSIEINSEYGISGLWSSESLADREEISVAEAGEVVTGPATLYTTINGDGICAYSCRVIRLDVKNSPNTSGMIVEIDDEKLLELTGGIVQGMSGSPIVQNSKLIGVVTHVFVNDPKRGFCLYAERMYKELIA